MLILAAILGSVLSVVAASLAYCFGLRLADRMPGEGAWPECLYCQRAANWYELLPFIGWLKAGPLASCPCAQRSSVWHRPVVEILAITLGGFFGVLVGLSPQLIWVALAVGVLLAIAMIDFQLGIIPDTLNMALAVLGMLWLLSGGGDITVGIVTSGALLLLGLMLAIGYSKLRGKEMMGLGDVKYFAAVGLWLTPSMVPWFLVGAGVLGALNGLLWQRLAGQERSPFAPALVAATLIYFFFIFYSAATS